MMNGFCRVTSAKITVFTSFYHDAHSASSNWNFAQSPGLKATCVMLEQALQLFNQFILPLICFIPLYLHISEFIVISLPLHCKHFSHGPQRYVGLTFAHISCC